MHGAPFDAQLYDQVHVKADAAGYIHMYMEGGRRVDGLLEVARIRRESVNVGAASAVNSTDRTRQTLTSQETRPVNRELTERPPY